MQQFFKETSKATTPERCTPKTAATPTCPARRSTVSAGAASRRPPRRPGASLWCCPTPPRRCQCCPRERASSVRPSCPPGGPCDQQGPPLPRNEGMPAAVAGPEIKIPVCLWLFTAAAASQKYPAAFPPADWWRQRVAKYKRRVWLVSKMWSSSRRLTLSDIVGTRKWRVHGPV